MKVGVMFSVAQPRETVGMFYPKKMSICLLRDVPAFS